MRWMVYGLMFLLGVLIGRGLTGLSDSSGMGGARDSEGEARISRSPRMRPVVPGRVGMDDLLQSELGLEDEDFSLKGASERLHNLQLSPQRTRALLAYGIEARDGRQLLEDFSNGKIGSLELDATVRRLTTEFPDETWGLLANSKIGVSSWEDFMTVINAVVQTLTTKDAPEVIDRFNAMEPSKHRQFIADSFSTFWAKQDPAAAAMYFTEVTALNSSRDGFAKQIVKSWNAKDPTAMRDYVSELPAGPTRQFFENAIHKETTQSQ